MGIDRRKLKAAIHEDMRLIKVLKKFRAESHHPHWGWKEMRQLALLKIQATIHCSIAASLRGRVHLKDSTLEDQKKLIAQDLPLFEVDKAA